MDTKDSEIEKGEATAFDALVERLKRDVEDAKADGADAKGHVDRLRSILTAALHEAERAAGSASVEIQAGADKVREQLKEHPMTTVSAAFSAGYAIGKAIAERTRK
jgi:ElaB/YqjD/DUF883 family membrane-anchored ribosome-binding protein